MQIIRKRCLQAATQVDYVYLNPLYRCKYLMSPFRDKLLQGISVVECSLPFRYHGIIHRRSRSALETVVNKIIILKAVSSVDQFINAFCHSWNLHKALQIIYCVSRNN